ncbi:hypothetical protein [Niabella aurantiaca]|uniref:hypothetical protein n=1 Tax=Niabella aurantiaca TaxID=379900 RepID=UPI00036B0226|nr:hypothetical protein [Niabella aurantiaca]
MITGPTGALDSLGYQMTANQRSIYNYTCPTDGRLVLPGFKGKIAYAGSEAAIRGTGY